MNCFKKPAENGVLRRLYRILNMPTDDVEIDKNKIKKIADVNCKACMVEKPKEEEKQKKEEQMPSYSKSKSAKMRFLEIFAEDEEI